MHLYAERGNNLYSLILTIYVYIYPVSLLNCKCLKMARLSFDDYHDSNIDDSNGNNNKASLVMPNPT